MSRDLPQILPLPQILNKQDVLKLLSATDNLKYRFLLQLLFANGLQIGEAINLKLKKIQSERGLLLIKSGKGEKARTTMLTKSFRAYYKVHGTKARHFDGEEIYSGGIRNTFIALIKTKATPKTLRYSFATHLLGQGTDLRYIQTPLGHRSSRTTEIYIHVTSYALDKITGPLDNFWQTHTLAIVYMLMRALLTHIDSGVKLA